MMRLIILMYHQVFKDARHCSNFYQIDKVQFREHLHCIRESGYAVINTGELISILGSKGGQEKERFLMLTFDDGHKSSCEIIQPLLAAHNLKGIFFISAGNIGRKDTLSWQELKYLSCCGHTIGSHGVSHRVLTGLSAEDIERELKASKEILEDNLHREITSFSVPRGFYNEEIINKAKVSGYKAVFTSDLGRYRDDNNVDIMHLRRVPVKRSFSAERLRRFLKGSNLLKERAEYALKKACCALVGVNNYQKLTLKLYQ